MRFRDELLLNTDWGEFLGRGTAHVLQYEANTTA